MNDDKLLSGLVQFRTHPALTIQLVCTLPFAHAVLVKYVSHVSSMLAVGATLGAAVAVGVGDASGVAVGAALCVGDGLGVGGRVGSGPGVLGVGRAEQKKYGCSGLLEPLGTAHTA
jgi:hypothetical protein